MRIRMITTFFGAHSFGGDAAHVDRLSRALVRRGHEVHVHYCVDSFNALRGDLPPRPYTPPPGVQIHPIKSPFGVLSPILTQATGRPLLKRRPLAEALDDPETDVFHFHNISLVGGPGVLGMGANRRAIRIMTAHEYFLFCPMHLLWKNGERSCDAPQCLRCVLRGRRPPQLWRSTGAVARGLSALHALIFQSRYSLSEHRSRNFDRHVRLVHLTNFLPDDWSGGVEDRPRARLDRPYLAASGRLVELKGFQRLIPLMKFLPEADLRIAGVGPFEPRLRDLAAGLPNVHFEGQLAGEAMPSFFRDASAVVVPSLFPETFGYVVLEAFAVGTPVIVHNGGGAIREVGAESGGGLGYDSDVELLTAMRRLVHDHALRRELGERGLELRNTVWSEREHMDAYFRLLAEVRTVHRPVLSGPHAWKLTREVKRVPD